VLYDRGTLAVGVNPLNSVMTGATSDFGLNLKISMKTASALPARNHGVWMCSSPGIRAATLAAARAKTVQKITILNSVGSERISLAR
jgi:hypothetical protein